MTPGEPERGLSPRSDGDDALLDLLYPQRPWTRRAAEFLVNLALGIVVFAIAGCALWAVYQWAVAPAWARIRIALSFEQRHSAADLREDLAFLRSALEEKHPRLTAYQTTAQFEAAFDQASASVHDGMTTAQFLAAAAPLATAVGCGHTGLRAPPDLHFAVLAGGRLMPLGVRFIDGRAYVAFHYADDVPIPVGSELLEIDGRKMPEVRDRLLRCLPSDGRRPTYNVASLELLFPYQYWIFVERPARFRIRYSDPSGAPGSCVIRAVSARSVLSSFRRQHPDRDPLSPPPPMRFAILDHAGIGYIRLATFLPENHPPSSQRLEAFFARVASSGVGTLIVDVRGNSGGPPPVSVELLRYLMPAPFVYLRNPSRSLDRVAWYEGYYRAIVPFRESHFGGRLFVLIDHGSFSTTGHFLAHLHTGSDAVLVGEESGGGALCNDASEHLVLPHSRLRLRVATKTFVAGVGDAFVDGGIVPDIEVAPTVEDIVAGRDAVLVRLGEMLGADLSRLADSDPAANSP